MQDAKTQQMTSTVNNVAIITMLQCCGINQKKNYNIINYRYIEPKAEIAMTQVTPEKKL